MVEFLEAFGSVLLVSAIIILLTNKKKTLNEKAQKFSPSVQRTRTYKKAQKLLRFQRGNKALNSQQQKILFDLNEKNLSILKQAWKNEHL